MNILDRSPLISKVADITLWPIDTGDKCQNEGVTGEIKARLLYTLQIVTSFVALPVIFLVGLFEAAFRMLTCQGNEAIETMQVTMSLLTLHVVAAIPASLAGVFTDKDTARTTSDAVRRFAEKVDDIWLCTCCEADEFDCRPRPNPIQPQQPPSAESSPDSEEPFSSLWMASPHSPVDSQEGEMARAAFAAAKDEADW